VILRLGVYTDSYDIAAFPIESKIHKDQSKKSVKPSSLGSVVKIGFFLRKNR